MPDLSLENQYQNRVVVGIDEVGRGSWAGPVIAGAVIINQQKDCRYIKDSKQIPKSLHQEYYAKIIEEHDCGIGISSVEEIVKFGLSKATFLAMDRAIIGLSQRPNLALVDGNCQYALNVEECKFVIKGDNLSISIAAASIIAKAYRDNHMRELATEWPIYGWHNNAGYGTKEHLSSIEKNGICTHHRTNYKPIQKILSGV